MFRNFFQGICDLLYPPTCAICKEYLKTNHNTPILCPSCQDTVEFNKPPFCKICSRHLTEDENRLSLCQECRQTKYHFDKAWAATIYNKTMQRLIHLFKYQQKTLLRRYFSQVIASFLYDYNIDINRFDIVVPIPLHPARKRERGYNQSQLIAQGLIDRFNIRVSHNNLIRIRNTANQALLGKKERWTNIRGAFTIKDSWKFRRKSVLIVDDLLTTGATACEVAHVLKEAEATQVSVLTLSIATLKTHENDQKLYS